MITVHQAALIVERAGFSHLRGGLTPPASTTTAPTPYEGVGIARLPRSRYQAARLGARRWYKDAAATFLQAIVNSLRPSTASGRRAKHWYDRSLPMLRDISP